MCSGSDWYSTFATLQQTYRSALQRMFLYLTTSTILLEAFHAMQIERQFHYHRQEQFCSALGFLIQSSSGVNYLLTLGITIFSMYTVYRKLLGDPFERAIKIKGLRIAFESLFLISIVTIPFTFTWIPFLHGNYGLAGPFCWIRGMNENCTVVGLQDQVSFYSIAETTGLISLIAAVVLAFAFCGIACKYKTVRGQQGKLVCQTLLLMCFLTTHVLTLTAGLLARYITDTTGR